MQKNSGRSEIERDSVSRIGLTIAAIKSGAWEHLKYSQGKIPAIATLNDKYMALAYTVKDRLLHRWVRSGETYLKGGLRAVSYLSAEFLIGPQLANNLINLGIYEEVRKAAEELGRRLECPFGARTGTRVGKWRAWSTGRLFFGLSCHSGNSLDRLRNTL